ncbi:MAG: hypothetical protein ACXWUG_02570 [Polyangiales bacterium]
MPEIDPEGPSEADVVVLEALWSGVINGWDDDARHTKFLDHARNVGALPEAARRYGKIKDDPERGELAKKRLAAIALLATNELYATRTTKPNKRVASWIVALGVTVCFALLGWAAWAFTGR